MENEKPGATTERQTLNSITSSFDLNRVRCEAEGALLDRIEKDKDFSRRLSERSSGGQSALVDGRLSLIKNSYRVDEVLSPTLHRLRELLRATLRLVRPIDLYVEADPTINAFCIPSRKGTRLVMCLNSALVNQFTPHELMFVMGHEIGHAVLGHGRLPRIDFDDPNFSPLEVVRLRALGRRQEISCDRVGLLACQSSRVAGSALLKTMSGLSDRWVTFDEDAFSRQFDQIADMAEVAHMDDVSSSHPVIGLRAKALRSFADSQLFGEALGRSGGRVATADLERETHHLLSVFEPDLTELESASEEAAANSLMTNGALAIVAVDGVLDAKEVEYLKSRMKLTARMLSAMREPDFREVTLAAALEAAPILSQKLSLHSRAGLLQELCRVALSAGGYAEGEQTVLARIAEMLEIPPVAFRDVVSNAEPPEMLVPADSKPVKRRRKRSTAAREKRAELAIDPTAAS